MDLRKKTKNKTKVRQQTAQMGSKKKKEFIDLLRLFAYVTHSTACYSSRRLTSGSEYEQVV